MILPDESEFTSSMDIDKRLDESIDYLLRLKSGALRSAYERFLNETQTLSSLLVLSALIVIFSIPLVTITALGLVHCYSVRDYASWTLSIVLYAAINFTVWREYFRQKAIVAENEGSLPDSSRRSLWLFQMKVFFCLNAVMCLRLTTKSFNTDNCSEMNLIKSWNCHPASSSHTIPDGPAILVMLVPLLYSVSVRGANFLFSILLWAMSMVTLVFCVVYHNAMNSAFFVLYYALGSLVILVESRRQNYFLFFAHVKLQEILRDKEMAADAANALEMRHMIANVAHDLKTPLTSFVSGLEIISHILQTTEEKLASHMLSSQDVVDSHQSILNCVNNMRNTNAFMLMTINRCIDYTKASKGLKLVPKCETIDLNETLALPLNCMKDIQHRVSIELQPIPKDICSHIITDRQWLQENVLCLLSNAVKYSNEGTVDVRVCCVSPSSDNSDYLPTETEATATLLSASLSAEPTDPWHETSLYPCGSEPRIFLRIEVEDHGIGLSDEAMASLFHPFRQAQRLAGGTGLGLFSLAKRIEALGGQCGVQRRRDGLEGSLFWLQIPYRPDVTLARHEAYPRRTSLDLGDGVSGRVEGSCRSLSSTATPSQASGKSSSLSLRTPQRAGGSAEIELLSSRMVSTGPGGGGGIATSRESLDILVVDDSPAILKMMEMMLRRHKHRVQTATNGAEALRTVQVLHESSQRRFDVILMDLQMPLMDGLEATRRLRAMRENLTHGGMPVVEAVEAPAKRLVIIGVSANSDAETAEDAERVGMDAFIAKPFTMDTFYRTLTKVTQQAVVTSGATRSFIV